MLIHPDIDPIALQLGPLAVRWYGLMYLVGFITAWWLARRRAKQPNSGWSAEQIDDLIFYCALGVVLGGRIGYILFYDFASFIHDPMRLVRVWEGGMAFHGGFLGVITAIWLFGRKHNKPFFIIADFIAPLVPLGLGAGRLGNFINGELVGRVTDAPWAMIFRYPDNLPRHPSQLYEFMLEGFVLFTLLYWYSAKPRPMYIISGLFTFLYGIFRFSVEFVREPDVHLGFLAFGWMTMGQLLSTPMIVIGLFLLWLGSKASRSATNAAS